MKILRGYKYIFFKFYKWSEYLYREKDGHEITSFLSLSFLVYVNLVTILLALKMILNISLNNLSLTRLEILFYSLMPAIPQYFLFLYKKRYLKIINDFSSIEKNESWKGTLFVWLYIIITFIALFGVVAIQIWINEASN